MSDIGVDFQPKCDHHSRFSLDSAFSTLNCGPFVHNLRLITRASSQPANPVRQLLTNIVAGINEISAKSQPADPRQGEAAAF